MPFFVSPHPVDGKRCMPFGSCTSAHALLHCCLVRQQKRLYICFRLDWLGLRVVCMSNELCYSGQKLATQQNGLGLR